MKKGVLVRDILTRAAERRDGEEVIVYKGPVVAPEIEISNPNGAYWDGHRWRIHDEPSIGPHGREYVFHAPLELQEAELAVRGLYENLTAANATTDNRSGIHFHLNVGDLTLDDVKHLVFLYCIAEPAIFHLMPERRGKIFCVPLEYSVQYMYSIAYALNRKDAYGAASLFQHMTNQRYAALNLAPIAKFGSVEFRMFPSTTDVDKVLSWMRCVVKLGEAGRTFKGDYISTIQQCSYDPEGVLSSIFPNEIIQPLIEQGVLGPLAMQGARIATDFVTNLNTTTDVDILKEAKQLKVKDDTLVTLFKTKAQEEEIAYFKEKNKLTGKQEFHNGQFMLIGGRLRFVPNREPDPLTLELRRVDDIGGAE